MREAHLSHKKEEMLPLRLSFIQTENFQLGMEEYFEKEQEEVIL